MGLGHQRGLVKWWFLVVFCKSLGRKEGRKEGFRR